MTTRLMFKETRGCILLLDVVSRDILDCERIPDDIPVSAQFDMGLAFIQQCKEVF